MRKSKLEPTEPTEVVEEAPKKRGRPKKIVDQVEAEGPKRGRGRPRKEVSEEMVAPKRPRGRPRKTEPQEISAPQSQKPSPFSFRFGSEDDDLPVPVFRPRTEAEPAPAPRTKERPERKKPAPVAREERKPEPVTRVERKPRPAKPVVEEVVAVSPPVVEPPKTRDVVRIPSDAPQVIVREKIPTLVRDGVVYPPIFFFGNAMDESRLHIVLEEIGLAAEAGVNVVVHYVEIEVDRDTIDDSIEFAAYLLSQTLEVNPNAQVIFRVAFTAPAGWEHKYKDGLFTLEIGGYGEPSVCDDHYWQEAENCLTDFVSALRLSPNADHLMGVHLERGEWFFGEGWGYDTSKAARDAFKKWAVTRYRNDPVTLCANWFDGQVQFDTINVPEYSEAVRAGEEFVRTGRKARRWVDYHLFLSDVTVERIGSLAHAAKKASDGYFLVGVSYGYTFEWSHPASGHLALGKLLRNPDVDFIAGPPSYKNREPGGSAPFPCPIDSFMLNGKLYISEEDFKTPISGKEEADDFNPVMRTPQALEAVHWRGLGAAVAHSSGVCWMDLWGNGWLRTHGIWERGAQVRKELIHRMAAGHTEPEVAVFIDERSLAYLVDQRAFDLLVQNVRESIVRSGLSVGFYLLSDLAHREHFPESKLYVFLNAWDVRQEVRSAIKTRLQKDGKVLFWLYCSALFDSGRDAIERVREVTGIAIKRQPFASRSGTTIVHRKHPICESLPEKQLAEGGALEPSYFAIPEEGSMVLAEYTATGLPSLVIKEFVDQENWTSVFLGEPIVTPALFRALGQIAGCHIWSFQDDVVHVQAPFLTIHCRKAGNRTITLPDKHRAFNLHTRHYMPMEGGQVRFQAVDGSTHCFMVGVETEIDAILNAPEADLLKVDKLPERHSDTIRIDEIMFDVEIMRLDTWVEESWNDEIADDLILKPSQMDGIDTYDTVEAGGSGERRKRGRRRRIKGRKPESHQPRPTGSDFDIAGMNVVFRKRD